MITSSIGSKLQGVDAGAKIIKLEAKGQKIQFRLASGNFSYVAKHFMPTNDGKWEITECPRLMKQEECAFCEQYFDAKRELKALDEDVKDKALEDKAKKYEAKLEFYYFIIDREDGLLKVLQTTLGVRLKIDAEAKELQDMGSSIMSFDYILTRTEQPGASYYELKRVDSSLIQPLSAEEEARVEEAQQTKLEDVIGRKTKESNSYWLML
jgi:hypothetical protein